MLKFNNEMTLAQCAGRNLDRELWKRNIKQVDFAKMIDRTPRTVRRWMYEGIPLLSDIELVAAALGVSTRDILFGEEDASSFFVFLLRDSIIPKAEICCPYSLKSIYKYIFCYYNLICQKKLRVLKGAYIMENGIIIENKTRGIYVDGKLRRDLDDINKFIEIFSEYFFFDYWSDKEIDASEGELSQKSMFSRFSNCAPFPCCIGINKFTYFNDPKFGAGYLKYIVLGSLTCDVILTDEKYKSLYTINVDGEEYFKVPDIDSILEICSKDDELKQNNILPKIQHIVRLCNMVFYEQTPEKQKEHLKYASKIFNEYFESAIQADTGWNYEFYIFDGANEIEDELIDYSTDVQLKKYIKDTFSQPNWDDNDKIFLEKVIELII